MNDGIVTILQRILKSDFDGAKKELESLFESASNEKERGELMAVNGIITGIRKRKEGALQLRDAEKIARAGVLIGKSLLADDFDRGYAETLVSYAKMAEPVKKSE